MLSNTGLTAKTEGTHRIFTKGMFLLSPPYRHDGPLPYPLSSKHIFRQNNFTNVCFKDTMLQISIQIPTTLDLLHSPNISNQTLHFLSLRITNNYNYLSTTSLLSGKSQSQKSTLRHSKFQHDVMWFV